MHLNGLLVQQSVHLLNMQELLQSLLKLLLLKKVRHIQLKLLRILNAVNQFQRRLHIIQQQKTTAFILYVSWFWKLLS